MFLRVGKRAAKQVDRRKVPEPAVAAAAEQATHLAGRVIMINGETLTGTARFLADEADAVLLGKQLVVLDSGHSVESLEATVATDFLSPPLSLGFG
jgi:hypothetical protein